MDYLEGLWYQANGYKQLVRYLASQDEINQQIIEEFTAKYNEFFISFNMALNQTCKDYAKQEFENGYIIRPDYGFGGLVVVPKKEDEYNTICFKSE